VPRSEKYLRSKKKVTVPTIGPSTDAHADAPPKINLVSSANPYRPFVLSHQRRSALPTPMDSPPNYMRVTWENGSRN
jgi:hypothetical protein